MTLSQRKIFITGTDTGVGKTLFTAALTLAMQRASQSVVALKPIAAGCQVIGGECFNDDAIILQQTMTQSLPYQTINPIALNSPVAPHIAAKEAGVALSVQVIKRRLPLDQFTQSYVLVEGAGGWLVPLNDSETMADYVVSEKMAVILVVGLKLGCINHALMTQRCMMTDKVNLIGWVANHIDTEMLRQQQNIETLKAQLNCPLLAEIPFGRCNNLVPSAADCINIDKLVNG